MSKHTLQSLGRSLIEKRGDRGVRSVAAEIGVSPATLSRIERGFAPDLETFGKVCRWLGIDPGEILGVKPKALLQPTAVVHFRKNQAIKPETAQALAHLIIAAQRALMAAETAHKSALGEPYWANVHTNLENLANSWKIRPKRQKARRRGTVTK